MQTNIVDKARPYQQNAIDSIRDRFAEGYTKVLLHLSTGGGKTFIFCRMIKEAVQRNKKCIVVVRGRKLVSQASKRLFREGVEHGILMANSWNYRPYLPVQVCSVDTLIQRNLKPDVDLIVIDEAHMADSPGYKKFLSQYDENTFIVSVTATPYNVQLSHVAETYVHPITMRELIEQGSLTPFRYFQPDVPDLSEVKIVNDDYNNKQLYEVMVDGRLSGNIVKTYKELVNGKRAIYFCVNIKHSKFLAEKFKNEGIRAEHCDSDTPDSERELIYKRLESGETRVVCNVGVLCTGVDIPPVEVIGMARPTKSYNLFVQMAGRGTRPSRETGKTHCILIDHAGNLTEHGFPTDEPEIDLEFKPKITFTKQSRVCKICFGVFRGTHCPECGAPAPPETEDDVKETNEKIVEMTEENIVKVALKKLLIDAKSRGFKPGWAYNKLMDKFGVERVRGIVPDTYVRKRENPSHGAFSRSRFKGF